MIERITKSDLQEPSGLPEVVSSCHPLNPFFLVREDGPRSSITLCARDDESGCWASVALTDQLAEALIGLLTHRSQ